jgi:Glycosyl hydrolases family 25
MMPDRSPRVRVILFVLAGLALILGAAGLFLGIQVNSQHITSVAGEAKTAAADAKAADADAKAADARVEAAAAQVAGVHADLCTFLHVEATTRHTEEDESAEAQRLYITYKCGGLPGSDPVSPGVGGRIGPVTIYLPDIASYQAGIDLAGALAVAIKVTEGPGYLNPAYPAELAEAQHHGAFPVPYHFLHAGNAAAQADWCHAHAGSRPLMLDVESTTGADGNPNRRSALAPDMTLSGAVSRPGIGDMTGFIDRYRALGGLVHLDYLPRWYWQSIGSPSMQPLQDRGMLLWSSDYSAPYTDAPSGAGWQQYGGRAPLIWQYSSSTPFGGQRIDFSAFRGSYPGKQDDQSVDLCLREFWSLALTGKWPAPPAPPGSWTYAPPVSAHATGGRHSVTLSWVHAPPPAGQDAPFAVIFIYKGHGACGIANEVTSYPRPPVAGVSHLFGALDPAVTGTHDYTAHIMATAADGTRARSQAYAAVQFSVSG